MNEIFQQAVDIMRLGARGELERRESGYFWLRHGARQGKVVDRYFLSYPEDLPEGADVDAVRFGALVHDIGKTSCVTNPGIWRVPNWKITPEEWMQINHHPTESLHLLAEFETKYSLRLPRETIEYTWLHHEKLNGSGLYGVMADGLGFVARFAGIIDQIVSRCEDREYRNGTPPKSFVQAFEEVYAGKDILYDGLILDNVWHLYRDNPHIHTPGNRWVFEGNPDIDE